MKIRKRKKKLALAIQENMNRKLHCTALVAKRKQDLLSSEEKSGVINIVE